MGKSSPPAAPDPYVTAGAQTATNIGTAVANNTMGLVDQITPNGTLTNSIQGYETWIDPNTGAVHEIPRYLQEIALNDQQQQTLDQSQQAQTNLAGLASAQSGFLKDYLAEPASFDTGAIEGRLAELGESRLDPRFDRERASLEGRLANQGLQPGSAAWEAQMGEFNRAKDDAYNGLYLSGRGQAMSELMAERNQPINEITALLSGSQVASPGVSPALPQSMPTTDIAGLVNSNYNQRLDAWSAQQSGRNSLMGGLFGLGASFI